MEIEFTGRVYLIGKLDAFSQLHVARKLGPAVPLVQGMVDLANASKDKALLSVLMLGHISDVDADFVVRKCLSVVTRREDTGALAKIQTPNGDLMFQDISMGDILALTNAVIEENLGDFFRTALASLAEAPPGKPD